MENFSSGGILSALASPAFVPAPLWPWCTSGVCPPIPMACHIAVTR